MRDIILNYLRAHPKALRLFWSCLRIMLRGASEVVPKRKEILLAAFGGRVFDDSPKALYEAILKRPEFDDWRIVWAFANPQQHDLERGEKIKIDTPDFFLHLLVSKVWISNSGMDRGIGLSPRSTVRVETWHGTPIKRIGSDQKSGTLGGGNRLNRTDSQIIRCAQSTYDRTIFERVFNASEECFLMCDLPRNDELVDRSDDRSALLRSQMEIPDDKKVLLYMPTYREYLVNEKNETYLTPPIDFDKWERVLGKEYVLLVRAHYAVSAEMGIRDTPFCRDVSRYPHVNDLYIVSDILISDYSSAFIDYSILDKPMLCFAYDLEQYEQRRGLYVKLDEFLPCPIAINEDETLDYLLGMDYEQASEKTKAFHAKYAPNAGNASTAIINMMTERIGL